MQTLQDARSPRRRTPPTIQLANSHRLAAYRCLHGLELNVLLAALLSAARTTSSYTRRMTLTAQTMLTATRAGSSDLLIAETSS